MLVGPAAFEWLLPCCIVRVCFQSCHQAHHPHLAADTQAKLRLSGDLLALDFSVPEEAPAEFRLLSYGSRQDQQAPGAGRVVSTPVVWTSV